MPSAQRGRSGPPDYVGISAFGSGTRWWHDLLLAHPAITAPRRGKELRFFADFCRREMRPEDVAAYHERFRRRDGVLSGEWTPHYMYEPWTPLLLHRAAPDARLIVLVSDPIDRYRLRLARLPKRLDRPGKERLAFVYTAGRGRYATQLRNVREYFAPEQVLVLQAERCLLDPLGRYAETLRFLGVDDSVVPRAVRRSADKLERTRRDGGAPPAFAAPEALRTKARRLLTGGPEPGQPADLWPDVEASLHEALDPEVTDLLTLAPHIDLSLWPNFRHLA